MLGIAQVNSLRRIFSLFCVIFWAGLCLAQPYIASAGFSRPFLLGQISTVPGFAVATDTGEDGAARVYAYWSDREGLYRRELEPSAPTETLLEVRGIRAVHAASFDNEAALAWVIQDIQTGETDHVVRWRGEEQVALETLAPFPITLGVGPEGPALLYSRTVDGVKGLFLWRWGGDLQEIYSSDLSIEKTSLAFDEAGVAHISWLEGLNDRQAVGVASSRWQLNYMSLSAEGETGEVLELGPASNAGIQAQTALTLSSGRPWLMWPGEAGTLQVAALGHEGLGLEPGYPVGVYDGYAYWTQEDSLKRLELSGPSAEPENLVWSPNAPEIAAFTTLSSTRYLTWYGASEGGGYSLYGATTATPATFGWRDHVAARLGWSPYTFWQAALGQVSVSLLVALLLSSALAIVFWPLSVALKQAGPGATVTGVLLGLATLLLGLVLAGLRMEAAGLSDEMRKALTGSWLERGASFVVSAALTLLLRLRADNERQMGILLSACLASFVALSLLIFLTFQGWLELWAL